MDSYTIRRALGKRVSMFTKKAPCVYPKKTRTACPRKLNPKTDRRIVININGCRYTTYLATLNKFPHTLLGDAQKRVRYWNNGELFLSRDQQCFESILFYYQSNGILAKPDWVSDEEFDKELIFFELKKAPLAAAIPTKRASQVIDFIWNVVENPDHSIFAKLFGLLSVLVVLISVVIFCLETENNTRLERQLFNYIEISCLVWFSLEYILRLLASPDRLRFIRSFLGIIDALVILPSYITLILGYNHGDLYQYQSMRALRMLRVFRIFKLSRYSLGLKVLVKTLVESSGQLITLFLCLGMSVILFSSVFYYLERDMIRGDTDHFNSIPGTFWFTIVSMTTVGYGDVVPHSIFTKMATALCVVTGIVVLLCLPAPIFITHFGHVYKTLVGNRRASAKQATDESPTVNQEDADDAKVCVPSWLNFEHRRLSTITTDSMMFVPGLSIYLKNVHSQHHCSMLSLVHHNEQVEDKHHIIRRYKTSLS